MAKPVDEGKILSWIDAPEELGEIHSVILSGAEKTNLHPVNVTTVEHHINNTLHQLYTNRISTCISTVDGQIWISGDEGNEEIIAVSSRVEDCHPQIRGQCRAVGGGYETLCLHPQCHSAWLILLDTDSLSRRYCSL
ncbi:hypothetical protein J6590_059054 [Homalodisca vitripennis]|nr:hypothetical protein J6590_059054 [Homalodisca vitripennis]